MTSRFIRFGWYLIFILTMGAGHVHAELRVMTDLEHSTCLQYEPVNIMVFLLNETHKTIMVGANTNNGVAELSFVVEHQTDVWLKKKARIRLRPIPIKPGEERSFVIALTDWYAIEREGEYRIQAKIKVGKKLYASPMVQLTVVPGIELTKSSKLVPGSDDALRSYRVLYWKRGLYEFAFLRVDEIPSRLNYGVFELGKIVRFSAPVLETTLEGDVTVRHQSAPDCFIRTQFKSEVEGVRFVDQTYEREDGSPYRTSQSRLRMKLPKQKK